MNMKSLQFAVFSLAACAASAWAFDPYIELDLDGVYGNGPDHEIAQVGDTVRVDVWVLEADPQYNYLISINFTVRGVGASFLNYQHITGWTTSPPEDLGDGGWLIQSTDFSFGGSSFPYHHGWAYFLFHGPAPGRVIISQPTGWSDVNFTTGQFTDNIRATFGPTTATEPSSWSQVKELFR